MDEQQNEVVGGRTSRGGKSLRHKNLAKMQATGSCLLWAAEQAQTINKPEHDAKGAKKETEEAKKTKRLPQGHPKRMTARAGVPCPRYAPPGCDGLLAGSARQQKT